MLVRAPVPHGIQFVQRLAVAIQPQQNKDDIRLERRVTGNNACRLAEIRKGIVQRITRHLADHSVNITNLQTEVIHHDTPLYVMMIEVEAPSFVDTGKLQQELAGIGNDIGVEISMKPKSDARF